MDKHVWKQVKTLSSPSHKPSSRWGHSCCVVGEDIVFFGGYADSNYMNDMWAFNSVTMKWRQIQTFGDVPAQRSNCTMNYDKANNQILIFGGGGANKQRFNSISVLDWNTKQWIQIAPKQNQVSPWERTYHAAQFLYPFLIVFGGQGVADMDDLWVFNFITLSWTEIKMPADKPRPCARRFHSSVLIGNQFTVIAGCYGKYRCLSDVYSIDLTNLIKTGSIDQLEWQQKKLKNSSFLTRWGHSSAVYDNKIYIFGGRFSNDLNDLLVADLENNIIRAIKTNSEAPPARRRHCSGFIGSSMLVFGGFNGNYFQDLHYISVHEAKSKAQVSIPEEQKTLLNCVNNQMYADAVVKTSLNKQFNINLGLIAKYFESEQKMNDFLSEISQKYSVEQLENIFNTLYKGYGQLNLEIADKQKILSQQQVFPETKSDKISMEKDRIEKNQNPQKIIKKSISNQSQIIKLKEQSFIEYFIQRKSQNFVDLLIKIGKNKFQLNRITLIIKSEYFKNLLMRSQQKQIISINEVIGSENKIVYEIFFNFLETGFLVIPDNASTQTYMALSILSDYFCVSSLIQICCNELMNMITNENVESILEFALQMKMTSLSKSCCDFWIKKAFETIKFSEFDFEIEVRKTFNSANKQIYPTMSKAFDKLKFELYQVYMQDEKKIVQNKKKQSTSSVEKQNSENNINEQLNY